MRTRLIPISSLPDISGDIWVDQTRKPYISEEGAYVPVRNGHPATHELPERHRVGRGYQKIGDVIAFHGHQPSPTEVNDVVVSEKPRGVVWISGHDGVIRTPRIVLLHGSAGEVTFRESGIQYRLDVEQVMFSQGNREEKVRVSGLVNPGETVADMFAGIGYFTLSLARAGAQVHAMEINPVSFGYLKHNLVINNLNRRVRSDCGDCRDLLSGYYNRIHMGHFDSVLFLPSAMKHSRSGTWLHVHMLGDRTMEIKDIVQYFGFNAEITVHKVKKAGPRVWHLVADVVIT